MIIIILLNLIEIRNAKRMSIFIYFFNQASGEIEFANQALTVHENEGEVVVTLIRTNGASGVATVKLETYDITATDTIDYAGFKGSLNLINKRIYWKK